MGYYWQQCQRACEYRVHVCHQSPISNRIQFHIIIYVVFYLFTATRASPDCLPHRASEHDRAGLCSGSGSAA